MTKFGSLRPALLLAMALALVPLALVSVVQAVLHFNAREAEVDRLLRQTALYAAHNERNIFTTTDHILRELARRPELNIDSSECGHFLSIAIVGRPFLNLSLLDKRGRPQCTARPPFEPENYARFRWWSDLRAHRGLSIGDQFYSRTIGKNVLPISIPLYDRSGAFAGALSASFDLQWLGRAMQEGRLEPNAIMLIADRSGRLLATSRPVPKEIVRRVGKQPNASPPQIDMTALASANHWKWASAPIEGTDKIVVFGIPEPPTLGITRLYFWANILLPILMVLLASASIWLATEWFVIRWNTYLKRVSAIYARNHFMLELTELNAAPVEFRVLGNEMKRMATSIRERDRSLNNALERQSAMAREIHHRVKNNLQIVSSLISLYSQKLSSDESQFTYRQIVARVDTLAIIQRLIERADTNPVVDMSLLFGEIADRMRALAAETEKTYNLTMNVEPLRLSPNVATPLALFAIEALSFELLRKEADLKHRNVVLSLRKDDNDYLLLSVDDEFLGKDSMCFGSPSPEKIFGALAEQLKGRHWFEKTPTKGCRLSLRIAMPFVEQDVAPESEFERSIVQGHLQRSKI